MSRKPQLNTRVEEDVGTEVEDFAEEHDLSKADATRRFILAGMAEYDRLPSSVAPSAPGGDSDTESGDSKSVVPTPAEVGHDIGRGTVVFALATLASLVGWVVSPSLVPLSVVGLLAYVTFSAVVAVCLIALGQFVGIGGYVATLRRDANRRFNGGGDP